MPEGFAPEGKPVDATLPGLIVIPAIGVNPPVVVFCVKPSRLAELAESASMTYTKLPTVLVATPTGFRPVFTVNGAPSELSALIGKTLMPPGPGFAGLNFCDPSGLF